MYVEHASFKMTRQCMPDMVYFHETALYRKSTNSSQLLPNLFIPPSGYDM